MFRAGPWQPFGSPIAGQNADIIIRVYDPVWDMLTEYNDHSLIEYLEWQSQFTQDGRLINLYPFLHLHSILMHHLIKGYPRVWIE